MRFHARFILAIIVGTCVMVQCSTGIAAPVIWELEETHEPPPYPKYRDPNANGHAYEFWGDPFSGNGNLFGKSVASAPLTWHEAKIAATLLSPPPGFGVGHLATISDYWEGLFLYGQFGYPATSWYIGFTDEGVEGEWRWIDDTPGVWQDPDNFASPIQTAYTNWGPDSPGNLYSGNPTNYAISLVHVFETPQGFIQQKNYWIAGTGESVGHYIVEWEPVPEPSTVALALVAVISLLPVVSRNSPRL